MLDLLLNVLLLSVDGACLAMVRRSPGQAGALILAFGALAGVAAGALALLVTGDPFAVMRAGAWLLFLHAPAVLLAGAWLGSWARGLLVLAGLSLAAVGVDAFFLEPRALVIERIEIQTDELDERVRIVVLSDIQTDRVGAYERRVFELAQAERPDLVLLPGDFVQVRDEERYQQQVAAFRELLPLLQPRLGIYAVQGNVDHRPSWADDLFGGTAVRALPHTFTETVGPLRLSALSFRDGFDPQVPLPSEPGFHLAFAHAPDFSLSPSVDADLLVAGHTHGGQVQLPLFGPPITLSRVPRSAGAGGVTPLGGGRHLVVSRGVGMERGNAPRLRFLCRPQIVVIELLPLAEGAP
jgi:predicted MPP superfamily phosphohydrolase